MAAPVTASKQLGQVQLGTGLTTIYTGLAQPPNAVTKVNGLWICNTDTAQRTFTLRIGTGSLVAANSLAEGVTIAANTTYILSGSEWFIHIGAGVLLQGLADVASKITITLFGEEIT